MTSLCIALAALAPMLVEAHVVPGKVKPTFPHTYDMQRSSGIMVCNSSGATDPVAMSKWGLVDLDWSNNKPTWSSTIPMSAEESMFENLQAIRAINPNVWGWVYRNGIKALPWHTTVRKLLEDQAQWGLFMPLAGCMPQPGNYVCGPNASQNLYHDTEQTPHANTFNCGVGVACGEYVFNHLNSSLRDFFLGDYFFGPTGAGSPIVDGFYVSGGARQARGYCIGRCPPHRTHTHTRPPCACPGG
jgi:hypothetical protein